MAEKGTYAVFKGLAEEEIAQCAEESFKDLAAFLSWSQGPKCSGRSKSNNGKSKRSWSICVRTCTGTQGGSLHVHSGDRVASSVGNWGACTITQGDRVNSTVELFPSSNHTCSNCYPRFGYVPLQSPRYTAASTNFRKISWNMLSSETKAEFIPEDLAIWFGPGR